MDDQFIDLRPYERKSLRSKTVVKVDDRSHIDLPLLVTHHDLISGEKGFSDGPNLPPTTPDTPENFWIDIHRCVICSSKHRYCNLYI